MAVKVMLSLDKPTAACHCLFCLIVICNCVCTLLLSNLKPVARFRDPLSNAEASRLDLDCSLVLEASHTKARVDAEVGGYIALE
jgi:hypothetical protein